MRKQITSPESAPPQGIYSPAIVAKGTAVYLSGQGPVNKDGEFLLGTFAEQAKLTFDNITILLEAAGTSWANVVRCGVFLADLADFQEMNQIYQKYLTEPYPARTTVQVGLPPGMLIEVDCIALLVDKNGDQAT